MNKKLALIFSTIFHPLLVPGLLIWSLYLMSPMIVTPLTGKSFYVYLRVVFLMTGVFPLILLLLLRMTYVAFLTRLFFYRIIKNQSVVSFLLQNKPLLVSIRKHKKGKAFTMPLKNERIFPFLMISVIYCMSCYLFVFRFSINSVTNAIFIAMTLLVILVTVITIFFKISIHATTLSASVGIAFGYGLYYPVVTNYFWYVAVIVAICGIVSTARLALGSHNLKEIIAGLVLGYGVGLTAMVLH
ncbi:hypothetical protein OO013_11065 [Mangrovivirga sp. M17]|uniref:PAP2 superfamily protein n=1 Tax=Mangrovivirga halotolerans TaxID=2993936 RepID=A0ABT3RRJ8_9BACT|nr:hypothetical protein [Mangrovivirga halotolerans]MCX2744410.1 hypothetical protein [Mangrovivirga halotolerans]